MPLIISIEGGDQAGKKTQSNMLVKVLDSRGVRVSAFSFPDYTTPVGKVIKNVLNGKHTPIPQVIHCLMSANRWEMAEKIRQASKDNHVLVMNRYYHSNLVYGMANGLDESWLESLDEGLPKSDMVILLDVTQDESFRRKSTGRDKFESDDKFYVLYSSKITITQQIIHHVRTQISRENFIHVSMYYYPQMLWQ